jgi:hypothetical protein
MSDQKPDIEEPLEGEEKKFSKTKIYNFTKYAIVGISVIVLFIGILGSMHWGIFSSFVMADFVSFINAYKGMFITLTGSIGIGGVAKNYFKSKKEKNEDEGKDIATGGKV